MSYRGGCDGGRIRGRDLNGCGGAGRGARKIKECDAWVSVAVEASGVLIVDLCADGVGEVVERGGVGGELLISCLKDAAELAACDPRGDVLPGGSRP